MILILSGDHIYKMEYDQMLAAHKQRGADATIAVLNVSLKEASRFGIMNAHEDGTIYEFEEKPEHPKSTLASMGIYIFTYKQLRKYLVADAKDKDSKHDFGMNIIPAMLNDNKKLYAWEFAIPSTKPISRLVILNAFFSASISPPFLLGALRIRSHVAA